MRLQGGKSGQLRHHPRGTSRSIAGAIHCNDTHPSLCCCFAILVDAQQVQVVARGHHAKQHKHWLAICWALLKDRDLGTRGQLDDARPAAFQWWQVIVAGVVQGEAPAAQCQCHSRNCKHDSTHTQQSPQSPAASPCTSCTRCLGWLLRASLFCDSGSLGCLSGSLSLGRHHCMTTVEMRLLLLLSPQPASTCLYNATLASRTDASATTPTTTIDCKFVCCTL